MEKKSDRFEALIGIIIMAGLITGIAGLLAAVFAFFNTDWSGAGICLVASALGFWQMHCCENKG